MMAGAIPIFMAHHLMREIDGWPGYAVSADGVVWSKGKPMRPNPVRGGYHRVVLWRRPSGSPPSEKKQFMVATLVAEAFIGPKPNGHDIDHVNGDRADNRVENLRYLPSAENRARWAPEARERTLAGVRAANTRISHDTALAAVWACMRLRVPQHIVAAEFGIPQNYLSVWCAGKERRYLAQKAA